jgi:hypothetical protein
MPADQKQIDQAQLRALVRELCEHKHACGPDCICWELRPFVMGTPAPVAAQAN